MKKYGINGDTIAPDNYVLGTYFNPKEAERYLAGNQ